MQTKRKGKVKAEKTHVNSANSALKLETTTLMEDRKANASY